MQSYKLSIPGSADISFCKATDCTTYCRRNRSLECFKRWLKVDRTTKWMPKNGEEYVVPEISRGYPSWEDFVWNGTLRDELRCESGIVCRGAGEALKLAKKMLAVAKKESEQHD